MADSVRTIPDVATDQARLTEILEAIKEIIEVREGIRGVNTGSRFVSYDELVELISDGGLSVVLSSAVISSQIQLRNRYQLDLGEQFTVSNKEHITSAEEYIVDGELIITGDGRLNVI